MLTVISFSMPPYRPLNRGAPPPAIFLRPVQAGPAGVGFLLLPGLADIDDFFLLQPDPAERRLGKLRLELLRRVGVDPFPSLGAEFGFLRGVIEIHFCFSSSL